MISWEDFVVHMDLDEVDGRVFENDVELTDEDKRKAIDQAWKYWCNDSFWLCAPSKLFDPGTKRYITKDKKGQEGLLVAYESGGVTPGDQFLWFYDEGGLPTGYKMWVKILPIGGVYATWDEWQTLPGGAKIATEHKTSIAGISFGFTGVKGGQNWTDLGLQGSPIEL